MCSRSGLLQMCNGHGPWVPEEPFLCYPWKHCWGLDLREWTRRLIPTSKTSLNLSAGLRWFSTPEGWMMPSKTYEEPRSPPSGCRRWRRNARKHKPRDQGLRSIKEISFGWPKVMTDHPRAQAWRPESAKDLDTRRRLNTESNSGGGLHNLRRDKACM